VALSSSLRFLLAWSRSSAMTDGANQSAIDLRCKNARDPQMALHLNQTRMPCTGCCFSDHFMLAVIRPECAGGVRPPEFVKMHDYSENRTWTWTCELRSRCLSGGTCQSKRIIVSPDPPICHSTLYTAIPMRYHTVSRRNHFEVAKQAPWQNRRRPAEICGSKRPSEARGSASNRSRPMQATRNAKIKSLQKM